MPYLGSHFDFSPAHIAVPTFSFCRYMYLATEPPQTMLARYVSPSAGRCQGVKTIYYRRVWGSGRLHEWSAHDDFIILPEHVKGRFTNRRAWRVLSVGTDDDQVYTNEV